MAAKKQANLWQGVEDLSLQTGMPASLDAEKAILGVVLREGNKFAEISAVVSDECFTLGSHKYIWGVFRDLAEAGTKIEAVTVMDYINSRDAWGKAGGGPSSLLDLDRFIPFTGEYASYVELVNEKLMLRRIIERAAKAAREALGCDTKASEIIQELTTSVMSVADGVAARGTAENLIDIIQEYGGFDEYFKGDTGLLMQFPWRKLNRCIRGIKAGQFIVVAARPGMGKSVFGLQVPAFLARKYGRRCVIFTFEMSRKDMLDRLVAGYAGIPLDDVLSGKARNDPSSRGRLQAAMLAMAKIPLKIVELRTPTFPAIQAWVKKASIGGWPPDVVVIDYIGLMRGTSKTENRQQEVSDISRNLKLMSMEHDLCTIALCQLNRAFAQRGATPEAMRPQLTDLRESGSLEQDANKVIFINRPQLYFPDRPEFKGKAELIIGKSREGGAGEIVTLDFMGERSFFYDSADENDGDPVVITPNAAFEFADTSAPRMVTV